MSESNLQPKNKSGKAVGIAIASIAIVAIAVIATVFIILPKSAGARELTKKLDLGAKYLDELNYEQAEVEYLAAIEIDPKSEDAYLGLAEVYIATGELDRAKEVLEEGLRKAEDTSEIVELLEQVCQELGVPMPEIEYNSGSDNGENGTGGKYDESLVNPDFQESKAPAFSADSAVVGNKVVFGSYEQDKNTGNGAEPIEWTVLDVQDGVAFLLSSKILDASAFGMKYDKEKFGFESSFYLWEFVTLRTWLNNEFYSTAFSDAEKEKLVPMYVGETVDWEATETALYDNVSLLSAEQLSQYFPTEEERIAPMTDYSYSKGLVTVEDGNSTWWIRQEGWAASVDFFGYIIDVNELGAVNGVRPCISVKVE